MFKGDTPLVMATEFTNRHALDQKLIPILSSHIKKSVEDLQLDASPEEEPDTEKQLVLQSDLGETPTLGVPHENEKEDALVAEQSAYFKKMSPSEADDLPEDESVNQKAEILNCDGVGEYETP